jgi:hypothetical protein
MSSRLLRFEVLARHHDRPAFACGEEALDRYFQTQVTQDIRRHIANCFVIVDVGSGQVAGYYTLSAATIPLTDLPPEDARLTTPLCRRSGWGDSQWTVAFNARVWVN